jgi:hypothetical protein
MALVLAGAQASMRLVLASRSPKVFSGYARATVAATALLLFGVGIGNITHPHSPITVSTVIITLGIAASGWMTWAVFATVQELAKNGNSRT